MHVIHIHEGKRMRLIQTKELGDFSDPEILSTGNFLDEIESWKIGANLLASRASFGSLWDHRPGLEALQSGQQLGFSAERGLRAF